MRGLAEDANCKGALEPGSRERAPGRLLVGHLTDVAGPALDDHGAATGRAFGVSQGLGGVGDGLSFAAVEAGDSDVFHMALQGLPQPACVSWQTGVFVLAAAGLKVNHGQSFS